MSTRSELAEAAWRRRSQSESGGFPAEGRRFNVAAGARLTQSAAEADGAAVCLLCRGFVVGGATLQDGRRQLFRVFAPGEPIWPTLLSSSDFWAEALTDVEAQSFVLADAAGQRELYGGALAAALAHCALLGRFTAIERLATFLVDLADRLGEPNGYGLSVALPITRQVIGDILGLTPETVSRLLARLRDEGAIETPSRDRIDLLDVARVDAYLPLSGSAV